MPATFSHCLVATRAIDVMGKRKRSANTRILGENNSFVIMGATGPDYPYLTDVLTTRCTQNRAHVGKQDAL